MRENNHYLGFTVIKEVISDNFLHDDYPFVERVRCVMSAL